MARILGVRINQWVLMVASDNNIPVALTVVVNTCTCGGFHPGRVEPASPIELTTSRIEALQVRRSCASSLKTFIQSFLHRA